MRPGTGAAERSWTYPLAALHTRNEVPAYPGMGLTVSSRARRRGLRRGVVFEQRKMRQRRTRFLSTLLSRVARWIGYWNIYAVTTRAQSTSQLV
jgi:hypothetical protein